MEPLSRVGLLLAPILSVRNHFQHDEASSGTLQREMRDDDATWNYKQ
jgi:hypothetical protein